MSSLRNESWGEGGHKWQRARIPEPSFVDQDRFLNPGHWTSSQDIPSAWSESLHQVRNGLWHRVVLKGDTADQECQMVLFSTEKEWVTKRMNARRNYSFACEILVGHWSLLTRKDPSLAMSLELLVSGSRAEISWALFPFRPYFPPGL